MSDTHQHFPAFAEHHTREQDECRPRCRTGERIDHKLFKVNMGKPGRQRNKRTHNRHHTAEKYRLQAVLVKPALRNVNMGLFNEEIVTVTVDEGTSALMSDRIREQRSRQAADQSRNKRSRKRQLARKNQETGKAQHEFTRNRNAGILPCHQHGNRNIPPRCNELQEDLRKLFHGLAPFLS